MEYGNNYRVVSNLAQRIRDAATQGKTIRPSSGLASREGTAKSVDPTENINEIRATYMNYIQDMFGSMEAEAATKFTPIEKKATGPVDMPPPGGSKQYSSEDADRIKAKLVNRGMPEHIAEGFVMNFVDESGLNPLINEVSPTVKGSRGGFGLYQLTGPRRVSYDQYAAEQGIDTSNPMEQEDAQLQFLFNELSGEESSAWETIQTAPNAGTAAAYVAKYFLRPSEEHLNYRVAQYTGRTPDYVLRPQQSR